MPAGRELIVEGVRESIQVELVVVQEEAVLAQNIALAETLKNLEDALNVETRTEEAVESVQVEVVVLEIVHIAKIERIQAVYAVIAAEEFLLEDLEAQGVEYILDVEAVEIERVCVQFGKVQTVHVELVVRVQILTIAQVLPVQVLVVDVLGRRLGGVALSLFTRYTVRLGLLISPPMKLTLEQQRRWRLRPRW